MNTGGFVTDVRLLSIAHTIGAILTAKPSIVLKISRASAALSIFSCISFIAFEISSSVGPFMTGLLSFAASCVNAGPIIFFFIAIAPSWISSFHTRSSIVSACNVIVDNTLLKDAVIHFTPTLQQMLRSDLCVP